MSYFRSINQAVTVSDGNCDTSNLAVNQIFTGTGVSTLGVNAIQVNFKADQNAILYVEQGPNDATFSISDSFNYYNGLGGNGWTTQATDAYARVRVKNTGTAPTTSLALSTVLCPIVEAVPRALSAEGNLKVGVYEIEGDFGTRVLVSPMDALKTTQSTRLIGVSFSSDTTDTNFYTFTGTGTGAATQSGGQLTLATGATASSTISEQSTRTARYVPANTNYYRAQVQTPVQGGECTRRWGAFNATDGYFFQYDGTKISCVARKATVDSTVASGSFNGKYGVALTMDADCNTYEIYWTNKKAYYMYNDEMLHTLSSPTTTAVGTPNLPVRAECNNGTGNTSNNTLVLRSNTINRLGQIQTQPTSFYSAATTTGVILKRGSGTLHGLIVGAVASSGGIVTIYDGTAVAGGTIIASFTYTWPAGGNFVVSNVDFRGLPFYNGLFYVNSTQNASATVIYE